ncbi:hypothetical protein [Bosea thiooxidans]|uniref:hypothetical protein n=1 Tax=Bosea thiooxidans TaxID=53254 RepID=UPI0012E279A2|nr:hypothetical protein [Bosea thiooxidans]
MAKTISGLRRALIAALAFVLIAAPTISAHPVRCSEESTAGFYRVDASKDTASQRQQGHGNAEAGTPSGSCCAPACNACGTTIVVVARSSSTATGTSGPVASRSVRPTVSLDTDRSGPPDIRPNNARSQAHWINCLPSQTERGNRS